MAQICQQKLQLIDMTNVARHLYSIYTTIFPLYFHKTRNAILASVQPNSIYSLMYVIATPQLKSWVGCIISFVPHNKPVRLCSSLYTCVVDERRSVLDNEMCDTLH